MRDKAAVLGVLAILVLGSIAPLAGGLGRVLDPTMYTVLTRFSDGSSEAVKDLFAPGANSSTTIKIPADALVKTATVEVSGELLDLEGTQRYDKASDIANGTFTNLSLYNGSLLLRPFLDKVNYSAGSSPSAIAAGDVNHDGHTDVIVVNRDGGTVGVFVQNTTLGNLEKQVTYSVGQHPEGLAVGDLNRDGRMDVAVACSGLGTLDVLYQGSDGILETGSSVSSGNGTMAVALSDLNRDGRMDAVTVNSIDKTLSLFIQDPNGNLLLAARIATGINPVAVAAGDISLDGRDEVVVANKDDSTIDVFVWNSTTYLARAYTCATGNKPVSVAIGDLNRDGRNDVAVAEQGNATVGVFLQTSSGVLGSRTGYGSLGAPYCVAAGDLGYDGRTDLVAVSAATSRLSVLNQRPDGRLSPAVEYLAGTGPESVAIGDFNHDGKVDLAVANTGANNISVLLMRYTPPGTLPAQVTVISPTDPHGVRIADLNADGLKDLGVAAWTGNVFAVYLQDGIGGLAQRTEYNAGSGSCVDLDIADLNGDGRNDAVTTSWTENLVSLFYQNAKGTFGQRVTYPVGTGCAMIAAGDLNSDGLKDFAAAALGAFSGTNICVFLGNSSGGFDGPFNYTPGSVPTGIAVGDLDSDGLDDIAVTNQYDNNVAIFYQKYDGTLQGPETRAVGRYPIGVAIADLSSDGKNDLAVVSGSANTLSVFIQDAQGTLPNAPTTYSTGTGPYLIAAGDIDSDGRTDLVVSNLNGANIGVFTQKADGTLNQQATYSTGANSQPTGVAIGDINGDGKDDIVVANEFVNNIGLFWQKFTSSINGTYVSPFWDLPYEVFEATAFWNSTVTGPNQNITVELSNDDGQNWRRVTRGEQLTFPATGSSLGYRIRLTSGALNETPTLDNITIRYTMHSYPTDPSLDVGARGTPIWNWTGPFGMSGQPTRIDFTERLNASLQGAKPDGQGYVTVPFALASGTLGRLRLTDLVVAYDLAPSPPVLKNYLDNEFTTSQTPLFKMTAWDNDTLLLQFRLEISQDNFTTIRSSYSQLVTIDYWDKPGYRPGEMATYQLSIFDKLTIDGEYQWRAFVWDGTVWSPPSEIGRLRVDTKAPTARVAQLAAYMNSLRFNVSWNGSDPEPGSGLDPVAAFDVQYKDRESSPWTEWLVGTNRTTVEFTGQQGKTYYFQVRSRDAAGNLGAYSMGPGDTRTVVDVTPPKGTVADDGEVTGDYTRLHATFSFNDFESDVIRFEYWIGTTSGGNETFGPAPTADAEVAVRGLSLKNGTRYFFSVQALNRAGLWSQAMSTDGIVVRLKLPYSSLTYAGGTRAETDIELFLDSTDPNNVGITDADLEYRVAAIHNRLPVDWSAWQEIGGADWGDQRPSTEPFVFTGEPGKAYRFRYRVRDRADTYSDFVEPSNVSRIDRSPEPRIVAPLKGTAGKALSFSANTSFDPDGDKLTFTWDFGDQRWGDGVEARHSFSRARKYTVTLYVDDGIVNMSVTQVVDVRAPQSQFNYSFLYAPLSFVILIAAAAGAYVLARRRKTLPGERPDEGAPVSGAEYAPVVVPGSERLPPAPPPPTAAEIESQVAAARAEVADPDQLGIEIVRTTKMLGLAESFLAEGNLEMASQYAKKTVKLARDQRARKESEIDEDAARKFITDTQKMLDGMDASGVNVKPAKRLMGLSISFMADGNYVTGMQYSKKVRKILDELRQRQQAPPVTLDAVDREIQAAVALIAELQRAGEDHSAAEEEVGTARMFLEEDDLPPALEHASKALALARDMKEKERPLTPQQWKAKVAAVREMVERGKAEGIRVAEPAKMLKFSESFALQGNLEVATQYVRKAEKLLNDMDARARVDATKPGPTKGPLLCPRCAEEVETDWVVCAFCNMNLKAVDRQVRVAVPVDDEEAASGKVAKVARPVEEPAGEAPSAGKCPRCGGDVQPDWKGCPSCEMPLEK